MIYHILDRPTRKSFEIPIQVSAHSVDYIEPGISGHLLEEKLMFSHSIGTISETLTEECLPAINRRRKPNHI